MIQKSTSLKYEPSSELLLITAMQLFLNQDLVQPTATFAGGVAGSYAGSAREVRPTLNLILKSLELSDTKIYEP